MCRGNLRERPRKSKVNSKATEHKKHKICCFLCFSMQTSSLETPYDFFFFNFNPWLPKGAILCETPKLLRELMNEIEILGEPK